MGKTNTKLLLTKDVPKLGFIGDMVDVSAGYARNYLLPHHKATLPTKANIAALAEERAAAEERRRQRRREAEDAAARLADVEVTIAAAANEEGVLYGSVGPREIAAALREEGHDINASSIRLSDPIKRLDTAMVEVEMAENLRATVKVWVVRAGQPEPENSESEDAGTEAGGDGDRDAE